MLSFKAFLTEQLSEARLALADEPDLKPSDIEPSQLGPGPKPDGFWYAVGEDWINKIRGEGMSYKFRKYTYEVTLDPSQILVVGDERAILVFEQQYGVRTKRSHPGRGEPDTWVQSIRWDQVAQKYSGVEMSPRLWDFHRDNEHFWYTTWDVASGCVWNPRAIIALRRHDAKNRWPRSRY